MSSGGTGGTARAGLFGDKVVEILQAINIVLAQSDIYTLLSIDGDMVRRAVYRHYRDSSEATLPVNYQLDEQFPREYLEKIVQFSIQLPPTSAATRSAYVRSLFRVPPPAEPKITIVASQTGPGALVKRDKSGLALNLTQVAPANRWRLHRASDGRHPGGSGRDGAVPRIARRQCPGD